MRTKSLFQKRSLKRRFLEALPIKEGEFKKALGFCLMKFFVSFLFTMLKIQKDANIALDGGAEKIPHAKVVVSILAIFLVAIYANLTNRLQPYQLFYGVLVVCFLVFGLLGFVIGPHGDSLRPDTSLLEQRYAANAFLKSCLEICKNWPKVFFYCLAELYGQFVIIIFFFSAANEVFSRNQAKRLYPVFIACGCLGGILGSYTLRFLCGKAQGVGDPSAIQKSNHEILNEVCTWIGFLGMGTISVLLLIFRWIHVDILRSAVSQKKIEGSSLKGRGGLWQALKYVAKNPYLRAVTVMIVTCAVATSLTDITYKKYLAKNKEDVPYAYICSEQSRYLGIYVISVVACLSFTQIVMSKLGWRMTAYIAPMVVMVTGGVFFLGSIFNKNETFQQFAHQLFNKETKTKSAIELIKSIGFLASILNVLTKYVFFDGAKEVAFSGLNPEERRKGKAAVDVVGSRLGKGLSGFVHMFLLAIFNTNDVCNISWVLWLVSVFFIFSWFWSIRSLAPKIDVKTLHKVSKDASVQSIQAEKSN